MACLHFTYFYQYPSNESRCWGVSVVSRCRDSQGSLWFSPSLHSQPAAVLLPRLQGKILRPWWRLSLFVSWVAPRQVGVRIDLLSNFSISVSRSLWSEIRYFSARLLWVVRRQMQWRRSRAQIGPLWKLGARENPKSGRIPLAYFSYLSLLSSCTMMVIS